MSDIMEARIRDGLDIKWLTPSQQTVLGSYSAFRWAASSRYQHLWP